MDADSVARISRSPRHPVQKQRSIGWRFTEVLAGHVSFDLLSKDFSRQECRGKGTSYAMEAYLTIEIHYDPKCEYIKSFQQISDMLTRVDIQSRNIIPAHVLVLFPVLRYRELLYEQPPARSSFSYQTAPTLKRRQSRTYWSWCPLKVSSFRSTVTKTSILASLSPSPKHGPRQQHLMSALRRTEPISGVVYFVSRYLDS
jgi:hypothetical protein